MVNQDSYDNCIENPCSPHDHTFSFRHRPCRYEQPACTSLQTKLSHCPFKDLCLLAEEPLRRLQKGVYGNRIKVTLSEPSGNIIVRSESHFHRDETQRLAVRKHFYEVSRLENESASQDRLGMNCSEIRSKDRFGRYLGFVDIRPIPSGFPQKATSYSPLSLGLLVPPAKLRDDPLCYVLQGEYAALFGAHGFSSTVYTTHDPATSGARCAQACVFMILSMLSDRGAVLTGTYTLTYLAKPNRDLSEFPNCKTNTDCIAYSKGVDAFVVDGFTVPECTQVLNRQGVRGYSVKYPNSPYAKQIATKVIAANLYARFPVMLFVDSQEWWANSGIRREGHAVVLVGVRQLPKDRGVRTFIAHDPGYRPFYEKSPENAFHAALKATKHDRIHVTFAADKRIHVHAQQCIDDITSTYYDDFVDEVFFTAGSKSEWDIRFCSYENLIGAGMSKLRVDERGRAKVLNALKHSENSRFWCIFARNKKRDWKVWIYDAENSSRVSLSALFTSSHKNTIS